MNEGALLVGILFLAVVVEVIVERAFGSIARLKGTPMAWISLAAGVLAVNLVKVDGLSLIGFAPAYAAWVGYTITGLVVSAGSNTVHKLFKKIS